jgi:hypothetical protein
VGDAVEFDGISGYLAVEDGPGIVVLHEWCLPEHFPRWFERMSNAEIHISRGTQHAFFNDTRRESYDEAAAKLSWARTVAFFRKHLA